MDRPTPAKTPPLSGFDLFWSRYPTKFNRGHAQAIWDDIDPTPAQQEAFLGALTIEAGDRERARRAGRQLPIQTGALWLIEHRDFVSLRASSTSRERLRQSMDRRLLHWRRAAADGSQSRVVGGNSQCVDTCGRVHSHLCKLIGKRVEGELPGSCVQGEVVALCPAMTLCLDGRLDKQGDGSRDCKADTGRSRPLGLLLHGSKSSSAAADKLDEVQGDVESSVQALTEVIEPVAIPDVRDQLALRDVIDRSCVAHAGWAHFSALAKAPGQDLQVAAAAESGFSHRADQSSISWAAPGSRGERVGSFTIAIRGLLALLKSRRVADVAEIAFMVAFPITLAAMAVHGWTAP